MSQKDDSGVEREQISLSAVYHQLDDHLGSDEAPYDVEAGLERLISWMGEERPTVQIGSSVERLSAVERLVREREWIQLQARAIERTASIRMRSSLAATGTVAFLSLLAGVGLLFGLSLVPVHAAVAAVVTVGIIDALMAFAVGYIHRTTMKSLQGDLQLSFEGETNLQGGHSRLGREADEPDVADTTKAPDLELVQARPRASLLTGLAGIGVALVVGGAYLAVHTPNSWVAITIACALVAAFFSAFSLVVIPAVWSSVPERRRSAQLVLYALLGLTVRKKESRATKSKSNLTHRHPGS